MLKIDKALILVNSIVESRVIAGYNIGITCNPKSRRQSYRGVRYEHFAIIDFELSASKALKLEKALYEELTADARTASCRKYRKNAKGTSHRPSLGGKELANNDLKYHVYVAWWNTGSPGY